jgi:hypothetical protein
MFSDGARRTDDADAVVKDLLPGTTEPSDGRIRRSTAPRRPKTGVTDRRRTAGPARTLRPR